MKTKRSEVSAVAGEILKNLNVAKKLLVVLLAASSVAAFADDMQSQSVATSSSNNGMASSGGIGLGNNNLYVGAGAGAAWNNVQAPAASFRLDGGYNFNQMWAVEVGTTGVTQSGGAGDQSMQYYDVSVKGTLPMGDMFALFAQVGGAYGSPGSLGTTNVRGASATQLEAGWSALTAVGAQMNITQQVSLNLTDYYYYGANAPQGNTNVVLGGIKYNF